MAETVLYGRDAELARLDAALAELGCGRSGAVVVTGEAGIGKTALLAELARRADARGWLVLEGRATEFERDEPFALFAGALDAYLAADPDPDLHDPLLHPLVPSWAGPGGPADRLRLHAAARTLLGRLGRRQPLLLMLDDLHWADAASVDLIGYLLRHRPEPATLLAAALRPAQAPDRLRLATDPVGAPDLLHLPLGPLGPDDVARMSAAPPRLRHICTPTAAATRSTPSRWRKPRPGCRPPSPTSWPGRWGRCPNRPAPRCAARRSRVTRSRSV